MPAEAIYMMYKFLTLEDNTEIVHSERYADGTIKVYIEKPDPDLCFRHATCILPAYEWEDVSGFSEAEIETYHKIISENERLIIV